MYSIGDWLEMKSGTNSRPLLSTRYSSCLKKTPFVFDVSRKNTVLELLFRDNNHGLETILRIRPNKNNSDNDTPHMTYDSDHEIVIKHPTKSTSERYSFDRVVSPTTSQREMYRLCGSKLVGSTIGGQNGCLFTYGASGSGKTYTMMGGASEEAGLLPRTVESLFQAVSSHLYDKTDIRPTGSAYISRVGVSEEKVANKLKRDILSKIRDGECNSGDWNANRARKRSSLLCVPPELVNGSASPAPDCTYIPEVEDTDYIIFASFVEIYNEKIYDLLVDTPAESDVKRTELRIRQDAKGPFVGGATTVQINTPQEAYKVLDAGRRNLNVAKTQLNEESSRSHCLFTVKVAKRLSPNRWGVSQLCFCDLAGSERSKKIGNEKKRLDESKTINKSLMQLGIVIEELRNNQRNPGSVAVSFRNSKLTRLMQSYLTGNSKTIIIVAVSQEQCYKYELFEWLNKSFLGRF